MYISNLKIFSISMSHPCLSAFRRHTASFSEAYYLTSWCLLDLPIIQTQTSAWTLIYPYQLMWNYVWIMYHHRSYYLCWLISTFTALNQLLRLCSIKWDIAGWFWSMNWEWYSRKPVSVFGWRDHVEPQSRELMCNWDSDCAVT